jgi:hypothetical protein
LAADAPVGLVLKSTLLRRAGPGGPARTRGSAPRNGVTMGLLAHQM